MQQPIISQQPEAAPYQNDRQHQIPWALDEGVAAVDVDEDHVGFAEQLVKGTGMFNALYNEIDGELVMKELYHCLPGKKFYSNASNTQGAINMAVMSSKNLSNRVKLKKRVIVTMAKETLKFGKKALAIVKRSDYYRTYMATSSFPSGKNYEDYCHFVREEMFKAREDLAKLDKLNPEEAERVINREAEAETEEYAGNDDFMARAYAAKYRKTLKADGRAAARVSEEREAAKERSQATSTQARGIPKEELFFQCQIAAHRGWQQSQTDLREKEITFTNINNRIQQLGRAVMDTQGYFPPQWFLHPEDHMDNVLFQRTYIAMNKRFDALDHQEDLLVNHEEQIKAKIASREAGNTEEGNIFNTFIDRTLEPMMAPVLGRSSGAQGASVRSVKSQRLGVLAYLTYNYMSRGMSPVLLGQLSSLFLNAMSKCSTSLDLNCCMDIFRTTISPFECDTLSTMLGTTSWFCSFIMSPPIPIPDVS
ncbi:hypothetical protein IV203_029211 [Nitzschia inconspicua]|uniref:Uncharacterized protein n=1 Tax=Nitzschia inconspicua TaxID=303405 RepID=A0A9K3KCW4_9STRA|nr:hypothetical protein IV203_023148 [Nitzschia inconspicua]KAG7366541.1 hypothetical protein IV203_029211 [Nitzschia inconspicua]